MKICILTSWNPWAEVLLGGILDKYHPHIAGIFIEKKYAGKHPLKLAWTLMRRSGWRIAAYSAIEMAYCRATLEIKRLFGIRRIESFHDAAKRYKIPVQIVDSFNSPEFLGNYRRLEPGLAVLVTVPTILKEPVLSVPKYGTLNFHPAILPDYKGRMPLLQTLRERRQFFGATLHKVVAGVDAGDLVAFIAHYVLQKKSLSYH